MASAAVRMTEHSKFLAMTSIDDHPLPINYFPKRMSWPTRYIAHGCLAH